MKRYVRFDDVYLAHFDIYGTPEWVSRSEAQSFVTKTAAHNAAKQARKYLGAECDVRVVVVGAPLSNSLGEEKKR